MAGYSPLMRSVTATNAANGVQLSALLAALEANIPVRLQLLILQMDFTATGSVYVGNSAVTAANCGANLAPGGSVTINPNEQGVILTSDIWIKSTAATAQINVTLIPVGA